VLDENYIPKEEVEMAVFLEIQIFMYTVLEEHWKTDKGKSLASRYETTHNALSIYHNLKKHSLSLTVAQLSGDTMLQYITMTRYPGRWEGTSSGFVLHRKEQVLQFELEPFSTNRNIG
jgi:hypothetical protein